MFSQERKRSNRYWNNVKSRVFKHLRNITLQRVPFCWYLGGYPTSFPIFRLTLVLGLSLFTEFIVSAYWSVANQPTTNLFPFGTSLSAFWLVLHNDDSIKRFVWLSMTSYARRDSTLGLQLPPWFPASSQQRTTLLKWGTCFHSCTWRDGITPSRKIELSRFCRNFSRIFLLVSTERITLATCNANH
jgi:hypothetical protein